LQRVLRRETNDGDMVGIMRQAIDTVDPAFTAHAAADMESVGFIDPDFWWKNGVEGGLVFDPKTGPTMVSRLDANLATRGEAVLADVPAERLQPVMRRYIGNLLAHYAQDPNRDQVMLQRIIPMLATDRSKRMGAGIEDMSVDLRMLIALSNGLAAGINMKLYNAGVEEPGLELPRLDQDALWNVPTALLRVLYATVNLDADPEAMATMFEQDSVHVSVLEAIRQRLRYKPVEPNPADTRLRYPEATAADMPEVLSRSRTPDAYQKLHVWRRGRRRGGNGVRGYGLFLSGGALS
jgi:hypothetical protein